MNKIPTLSGPDAAFAARISEQSSQMSKANSLSNQEVKSKEQVEHAAGGFEALLLQEMMQSMWSTVDFAGMFQENSNEAQIYRDMLNQAISDTTAKGRGIGVKEFVSRELLKKNGAS